MIDRSSDGDAVVRGGVAAKDRAPAGPRRSVECDREAKQRRIHRLLKEELAPVEKPRTRREGASSEVKGSSDDRTRQKVFSGVRGRPAQRAFQNHGRLSGGVKMVRTAALWQHTIRQAWWRA